MNLVKSGYFYIAITITFTVIGQLLVKAGINRIYASSVAPPPLGRLVIAALLHPAVLGGLLCAFVAAISWFPAVSRLPLSTAYPFMALPIVLVLFITPLAFNERVSTNQWLGVIVVSIGLWLGGR